MTAESCIILTAQSGDVRRAKTVFTNAVVNVLGKGYKGAPWFCVFVPGVKSNNQDPRWLLSTTESEWSVLMQTVQTEFTNDGWSGVPLDCYRD